MKTAGTFDKRLMLIDSTTDVTATVTGSAVDLNGEVDMNELNVRIVVPSVSGTTPKIVAAYQGTDDGTNWTTLYTFPDITAAGEYNHKMRGKGRYRRLVLTVSGTSPNFGKVKAGISTGGVF